MVDIIEQMPVDNKMTGGTNLTAFGARVGGRAHFVVRTDPTDSSKQ